MTIVSDLQFVWSSSDAPYWHNGGIDIIRLSIDMDEYVSFNNKQIINIIGYRPFDVGIMLDEFAWLF